MKMGRPCKPKYLRTGRHGENNGSHIPNSIFSYHKNCRYCGVSFHICGIVQYEKVCSEEAREEMRNSKESPPLLDPTSTESGVLSTSSLMCQETNLAEEDRESISSQKNDGHDNFNDDVEGQSIVVDQQQHREQECFTNEHQHHANIVRYLLSSNDEETDTEQDDDTNLSNGQEYSPDKDQQREDTDPQNNRSKENLVPNENSKENPLDFPLYLQDNGIRFSNDDRALLRLAVLL